MKKTITFIAALFFTANVFAENVALLHAKEWSVPKNTAAILSMPAINESMKKLQKSSTSILKLKYPGGDEGTLWVNELRSWLVTLGLSSKRIELVQGSAISTTIELDVLSH